LEPDVPIADDVAVAKPTSFDTDKYAPSKRIGKPKIGVDVNRVERVGLGGLKTITSYGNQLDV
jgi:hypothetical protein